MKKILFILLLVSSLEGQSQENEFTTYSNGLIYSEYAMSQLSNVVDSLNLKFRSCDFDKKYYAKSQTIGHFIELTEGDMKQARKDLKDQISFNEFLKKYPKVKIRKKVLVVRYKYKNYEKEDVIDFSEVNLETGSGRSIEFTKNLKDYSGVLKNKWIYDYTKKSEYWDESISAFYFSNGFESKQLKENYARMIGYADCMIDTTTVKFKKDAESGWVEMPKKWQKFSLSKKEKLLKKLRNTKVYGSCSMDDSPRVHAVNIALLSAETLNWKIFLRSHMDILNDNFERASDGSYALARRKTHMKELEALDINVSDLIFGISLRVENPAQNHYFGSISRIGRAISESQNKKEIANQILNMIKDFELDDYNRVLAYFLYLNYNHYTKNEKMKLWNQEKLKRAVDYFPKYIKEKIKFK